jgi:hypothetical protein
MEEMRARIDRGDGDREVEETIQVSLLTLRKVTSLIALQGHV